MDPSARFRRVRRNDDANDVSARGGWLGGIDGGSGGLGAGGLGPAMRGRQGFVKRYLILH